MQSKDVFVSYDLSLLSFATHGILFPAAVALFSVSLPITSPHRHSSLFHMSSPWKHVHYKQLTPSDNWAPSSADKDFDVLIHGSRLKICNL